MDPSSLLNYYPNYRILDEILSYGEYDSLNLFIDMKNNYQTLYMEHAIVGLVESTIFAKRYDTSIVSAMFNFISFHKKYAFKRGLKNLNFYIFFETGDSVYHKNIRKKYKIRRKIDDLYGLSREKRDMFYEITHRNYRFIEKIFNMVPGVKILHLEKLEADFVPYYLLTRNLVSRSSNVANVTYSSDHDLYQNLVDQNTFNFIKNKKNKYVLKKGEGLSHYTKSSTNIPDEYMPVLMAIMGDDGDDVDGIKGLGPKTTLKILDEFVNICGGIENLYSNVLNGNNIFPLDISTDNKHLQKVFDAEKENKLISDNLKLVSFELISREFDNPSSTEMINRKNKFLKTFEQNKIITENQMIQGLNKLKIFVEDDVINDVVTPLPLGGGI